MNREWLINIRENARLKQEEVAEKTGISRQYYGMIENGVRKPSVEVAKAIAKTLEFNWTIFFDQEGNKMLQNETTT